MKQTLFLIFTLFFLGGCKKEAVKTTTDWQRISDNVQFKDEGNIFKLKSGKFSYNIEKSRLPYRSAVLLNASLVGYFTNLGLEERIIGISSPEYVYNAQLQKQIASGEIQNVGNEQKYNIEKILALNPDVIFTNYIASFENTYELIRRNGIEIIFLDEYLEQNPLDKTRYLLVFGQLFGAAPKAEAEFEKIRKSYDSLKTLAATATEKPVVLANEMYGNQWFLPGGKSNLARFIADANASYINAENSESRAIPMGFEEVYAKASHAKFWVNIGNHQRKKELLQINPNYAKLPVYNSGALYTINARERGRTNDYFESGVVRADLVLKDYIRIFHPEFLPSYQLTYLKELK